MASRSILLPLVSPRPRPVTTEPLAVTGSRVVIHGTMLGGYPSVLIPAAVGVLTPVSIWLYPAELVRWLISAGMILIGLVIMVAILRSTFVEIHADRIRWFFRQPQSLGEEGVDNLRLVTRCTPNLAHCLSLSMVGG